MENVVSKSKFKSRALEYFREVEKTGQSIIITDGGKPVLKIIPYSEDPTETLKVLRNSDVEYVNPTDPVGLEDWEVLMIKNKR
jgi:prevent-host-death family protein